MNYNYNEFLEMTLMELENAVQSFISESVELDHVTNYGTVKEKVAFIVDRNERASEDYNFLCMLYWATFDEAEGFDDLKGHVTPAESITRSRRKLFEERRADLFSLERELERKFLKEIVGNER